MLSAIAQAVGDAAEAVAPSSKGAAGDAKAAPPDTARVHERDQGPGTPDAEPAQAREEGSPAPAEDAPRGGQARPAFTTTVKAPSGGLATRGDAVALPPAEEEGRAGAEPGAAPRAAYGVRPPWALARPLPKMARGRAKTVAKGAPAIYIHRSPRRAWGEPRPRSILDEVCESRSSGGDGQAAPLEA
ncbi:hypothetical protein HT031_004261 [Scenedesmus sp. PABB004]|nr:hypothetical protein HT031_004261 [Scenedesmus sp. PABB004]